MKNPDLLWRDVCRRFAAQSKCKSRQVGAVLVKDGALIAEGWNSAPLGCTTDQCPRAKCNDRIIEEREDGFTITSTTTISGQDLASAICTHAEANAIANAARRGVNTQGSEIYSTTMPCVECSKLIVSAGIKEVIYDEPYPHELSLKILEAAHITIRNFNV